VETREAARRWAETWQRAWSAHDSAAIAALYGATAHFQSHPFRVPEPASEYVERVFAEEASAQPQFAEPVVDGDRVVVEWRSRVQLRNGHEENLAGVSILRFDDAGLVNEQRDIWCPE
jgi:hypothetical protein